MAQSSQYQSPNQTTADNRMPSNTPGSKFAPDSAPMNLEKVSEMNMETEGAPPEIGRELIAVRAHEIWEESGRVPGRDDQNWLEAEQDFRSRKTHSFSK